MNRIYMNFMKHTIWLNRDDGWPPKCAPKLGALFNQQSKQSRSFGTEAHEIEAVPGHLRVPKKEEPVHHKFQHEFHHIEGGQKNFRNLNSGIQVKRSFNVLHLQICGVENEDRVPRKTVATCFILF